MTIRTILLFLAIVFYSVSRVSASSFECLIEPRQVVEIRASTEGLIKKIHVDRGDFIKKDQVLIELDTGVDSARYKMAKYKTGMLGVINAAKSRVDFSVKKLKREDDLYEKKFVSANERDEAETEKKVAEAQLIESEEDIQLSKLEMNLDQEVLRLKTIVSPFEGVVMERSHHPGEVAQVDDRLPIVKLAEIGTLYVEVVLPTSELGKVHNGDTVTVIPEPGELGPLTAKVTVVDPVVDAASGTFGVRLELKNADYKIPAGIRCKADFK